MGFLTGAKRMIVATAGALGFSSAPEQLMGSADEKCTITFWKSGYSDMWLNEDTSEKLAVFTMYDGPNTYQSTHYVGEDPTGHSAHFNTAYTTVGDGFLENHGRAVSWSGDCPSDMKIYIFDEDECNGKKGLFGSEPTFCEPDQRTNDGNTISFDTAHYTSCGSVCGGSATFISCDTCGWDVYGDVGGWMATANM